MRKITEEEIEDYVQDVGKMEREHRRGSTFHASVAHIFTQEDVDWISEQWDADAAGFLGAQVGLHGIYNDDYGWDELDISYQKVEEHQVLVPEVVIPEHYVTEYKTYPFDPVWDDGE